MLVYVHRNPQPVMNDVQSFTDTLFQTWNLNNPGSVAVAMTLYFLAGWLITLAAAFCKVREPRYYVGLLSLGLTLILSLLLSGLCRHYLPDLAKSFTPSGLMMFSSLIGLLVFSVPLLQVLWKTDYLQGAACLFGGIAIFLLLFVGFQMMTHPIESLPARLSVPLFEEYQLE